MEGHLGLLGCELLVDLQKTPRMVTQNIATNQPEIRDINHDHQNGVQIVSKQADVNVGMVTCASSVACASPSAAAFASLVRSRPSSTSTFRCAAAKSPAFTQPCFGQVFSRMKWRKRGRKKWPTRRKRALVKEREGCGWVRTLLLLLCFLLRRRVPSLHKPQKTLSVKRSKRGADEMQMLIRVLELDSFVAKKRFGGMAWLR